ncbi:MAG: chloride channel protein, partial [Planctomycetota bacterium]|nr:chloride channel protein [Planctomycetota bacterium]
IVFRLIASTIPTHGVGQVIWSVNRTRSRLPLRLAARQWIASTCTIGSGGSAGPEGPIITIGASIGSAVGKWMGSDTQQRTMFLGCAAAAGLAAVFNAPLAGVFFVLEVLLRDFSVRMLTPIIVASVMGAATAQGLLQSNKPIFGVSPDQFNAFFFELDEVPTLVVVGIFVGVCGGFFVHLLRLASIGFSKLALPRFLLPASGAVLLTGLGFAWHGWTQQSTYPPFFGNGYNVIEHWTVAANYEQFAGVEGTAQLVQSLAALLILRAVATAMTIGSGACGGLFGPSLVLGAVAGALCAVFLNAYSPLPDINPVLCAVVGMAAFIAGGSHAPLTGVMLAYEITRNYSVMLPLLLVATLSYLFARMVSKESVYTGELSSMGLRLGGSVDLSVLRRVSMEQLLVGISSPIQRSEMAETLLARAETTGEWDFVVSNANGSYAGIVAAPDLRAAFAYREAVPLLSVEELMRSEPPLYANDTLDVAFEAFSRSEAHGLAVVDQTTGKIRGIVTRHQVMLAYQRAMEQ